MKPFLSFLLCYFPFFLFCQSTMEGKWTPACGASSNTGFAESTSVNFRYISSRFRWSDVELTAEEEEHPEKFSNMRFMLELIYTPPINVLCSGFNIQYRFLHSGKLNVEAYGGPKIFFIPGPDFETIKYLKGGKQMWFINMGLLCQLDFDMLAPFFDIGVDGIITAGTELNIHAIYKKPKNRYHLRTRKATENKSN